MNSFFAYSLMNGFDSEIENILRNQSKTFNEIARLEISNIMKLKDDNNLWIKEKNTQKRKEMI